MLVRSIRVTDVASTLALAEGAEAVELRLDGPDGQLASPAMINQLCTALSMPVLATCHSDDPTPLLRAAIAAGAALIDIPGRLGAPCLNAGLVDDAHAAGVRVVASWHDYAGTPDHATLAAFVTQALAEGADIAKVACLATCAADVRTMLAVPALDERIVALSMGERGRITRIVGAVTGQPLCFVAPDGAATTAPGQLTESELRAAIEQWGGLR